MFSATVQAATYYADYVGGDDSNAGTSSGTAWQRSPGMVGFSGSYSHSNGDVILFKGGITWAAAALPLTLANSGASGSVDEYRTATSAEWSGSSGEAIFDGEGNKNPIIDASGKSYFKLDDLNIIDSGVTDVEDNYKGIQLANCQNFEISNCTITPFNWIAIYTYNSSGTKNNYNIHHNDISDAGMGIVVANVASGAVIDGVNIYNNAIHDFDTKLVGSIHGDGIHTWGVGSDATAYITNMLIYNNSFYGNWEPQPPSTGTTAWIFIEHGHNGVKIYNNTFTHSGTPSATWITNGAIYAARKGAVGTNLEIYNNTISTDPTGVPNGISFVDYSALTIRNNIIDGVQNGYDITTSSDYDIDYSCIDFTVNAGKIDAVAKDWSAWQGLGHDGNGINTDPLLNADLTLTSSSPAIDIGTDLSGTFTTDKNGVTRAQGAAWDMGAYEFLSDVISTFKSFTGLSYQ